MKRLVQSLVMCGVVGAVAAGEASAQMPVSFGVGGGATIPLGSTSDFPGGEGLSTGWHGMALVRFKPPASPVGFQIDGMYHRLGFSDELASSIGDGKRQLINGTANLVFSFPVSAETRFRPYLIGGVGLYNSKNKLDSGVDSESETDFGFNAGAGFDVGFGGGTFFVEGRFHNVFVSDIDDTKFIPITAGIRFGGN
ncbi:MAG: outer membrane beta-barrel protein [Gemmatimonadales bacterium]